MSQDLESKREDKTDFAERLGTMNKRWQTINVSISEEVKHLEFLMKDWLEYERGVKELNTWFEQQKTKLRKFEGKVGHETSVQQAVKMCQVSLVFLIDNSKISFKCKSLIILRPITFISQIILVSFVSIFVPR